MNDIIPIITTVIGSRSEPAVDLRKVHAFLGVKRHYADWIKERIRRFGFVEGIDFVIFSQFCEKTEDERGRPSIEYHGTIGMAKELAMVQNNAKGKEARLYFIECERRAKEAATPAIPNLDDPAVLRRLLLEHNDRLEKAREENARLTLEREINAPKVEFVESFEETGQNVRVTDAGKVCGVGPKWFKEFLLREKYCGRRSAHVNRRTGYSRPGKLYAKQEWINRGIFTEEPTEYRDPSTGEMKVNQAPRVTPKGVCFFRNHPTVKAERERIGSLMRRAGGQGEMRI